MLPFGEWRPDVSDHQAEHSQNITGVVPSGDGYSPFPSMQELTDALPAACRGYIVVRNDDASLSIFAGTDVGLYLLDNSDFSWTDVSKSGGYTLATGDQWQFAKFNSYVVAVFQGEAPQYYLIGTSTDFDDLAGSPPHARYVAVVGRFLVLSGLLSNPNRIAWCDLNDVTNWSTGQADTQDLPDGGVTRGVAGGEYGIIFQDTMIRRLTYVGPPLVFQIDRIEEGVGIAAPYSLIQAGDRLFFYSALGFRQIISGSKSVSIGKERVDDTFLADCDFGSPRMFMGTADPTANRIYWAYKSIAGQAGLFDKMLCYDWLLDRFTTVPASGEFLSSAAQPGLTLEGLDAISASIDALTVSLDDFASQTTSTLSAFNSDHKLALFSGPSIEATLETAEQTLPPGRMFIRGFAPYTDASEAMGSVSYRETVQAEREWTDEVAVNAQGFVPQRRDTKMSRARVRIPADATWTYITGVEPDIVAGGQR